jgi:hypothetical protein
MMPKRKSKQYPIARKIPLKVQQNSQEPPQALLKDMKEIYAKHDWPGNLIGRALAVTASSNCPPGTTPHEITYQLPDGTWVTKTVCLPNTSTAAASLPGDSGAQDDFASSRRGLGSEEVSDEAELAGDPGKQDD